MTSATPRSTEHATGVARNKKKSRQALTCTVRVTVRRKLLGASKHGQTLNSSVFFKHGFNSISRQTRKQEGREGKQKPTLPKERSDICREGNCCPDSDRFVHTEDCKRDCQVVARTFIKGQTIGLTGNRWICQLESQHTQFLHFCLCWNLMEKPPPCYELNPASVQDKGITLQVLRIHVSI